MEGTKEENDREGSSRVVKSLLLTDIPRKKLFPSRLCNLRISFYVSRFSFHPPFPSFFSKYRRFDRAQIPPPSLIYIYT